MIDPHAPTTPVSLDTPTQATEAGRAATSPADPEVAIAIGERLGGRYLVTAFLGEGGMGAVYRAVDEKLGEDVALKVVRGNARSDALADETRLAQKVTHPNVCRTYDLEEIGGHQLVKMEYVAGETLVARLGALGRFAIDDAVRIARAIADGLSAAHAQGIVHRDLKPANVMLSGERVVLMDFGVARRIAGDSGKTAGTLGYMAPEQIANLAVDGAADLYALGCVLYEMLAGERVFASDNRIELAVRHVSVPAPDVRVRRPDTPRWLARAVARLLTKEPGPRALGIAALRAGPRRWRRLALPAAAFALAALGAGLAWSARSSSPPCTGIEQRLAGVWDPAVRQTVHDAFAKTKLPFAEASFAGLSRALDDYTATWTAGVADNCRATRVRKDQTEEVHSVRENCFDERFAELRALTKQLADADAKLVEKGDKVVSELQPLPRCDNVGMLRAPGLPPADIAPAAYALTGKLAEARVQLVALKLLPALVATEQAVGEAKALRWPPLIAEANDIRCTALAASGNIADALQTCKAATWAAMRGKRDELVASGALSVAMLLAQADGKPAEAQIWADLGDAAAQRAGTDLDIDVRRYYTESLVAAKRGDFNAAVSLFDIAFANAVKLYTGHNPVALCAIESDFGTTLENAGAYGLGLPHLEHAFATCTQAFGPDHPDLARQLSNLGLGYRHTGELAKAHDALSRSLAIRERELGKQHPILVPSLDNLAELLAEEGDHAGALAMMERAKAIARVVPGTGHPAYHQVATDYAELLVAAGRLGDARRVYDETLALERGSASTILPKTQTARANLAVVEQNWADAAAFAEQAIAGFEAEGGKDQPELWQPLTALARAKLALHDRDAARALLDRAMAIADKAHIPEHDLAPTRAVLELAK
jgi:serine/threonine-protein kinase